MVAALYRRYRPESFAEMIGQSQVTEPLMTALRTGRIGHAYLFSGPRGCGKTTSARILARCLNCAEGPTDTPCGTCPSCVELSRDGGGSLDVVEIDAASHGGVDDARDLRERAVFAPARDRFKIFIIDEAHMVTAGGFNALLKIVEEPPPHVKFVFATTEPDKVIGTIRSRTHHYPFRLIAPGTLVDYVQSLCDSEGVGVEPGVLPLVVRAGGGSVRDTLSILDQLIAGSEGDTVTLDRAAGLLGFTHTQLIDDVVTALGAHDPAAAFGATDRVVQTGQDPRRFVEDLLERLRDLIVVGATTVDGAAAVFRGVPQDQLTRMFEQSQAFGRGELSRIADTVSAALDSMAGATAPRLQLELMIARALLQGPVEAPAAGGAQGVAAGVAQGAGAAGGRPAPAVPQGGAPRGGAAQGSGQQAAPQGAQPPGAAPRNPGQANGFQGGPAGAAAPKADPLAALAAARDAATGGGDPAAGAAASAQATANNAGPAGRVPGDQTSGDRAPGAAAPGAPAPDTGQAPAQSGGAPSEQPNAAETAASIREFLREDPAGTPADSANPAAVAGGAAEQQRSAQPQSGEQPAGDQRAAEQGSAEQGSAEPRTGETERSAPRPGADRPAESRPAAEPGAAVARAGVDQSGGEPHPNAGAASFGRPITDVLSNADIAGIGREAAFQAPAGSAPSAPSEQPAAPAASPTTAPAEAPAGAPADGATPGGVAGSPTPPVEQADADGESEDAAASPGGFEDLVELWPELLEEILQNDRDAWNAVRAVQPLGLDGDVLTVGLASQSDLAMFKEKGAGPLRETINSAIGLSVKYVPKRVTPGSASREAGSPQQAAGSAGDARGSDSEEPDRGGSRTHGDGASQPARATPAHDSADPEQRAAARLSALGPALAAPAWAGLLSGDPVSAGDETAKAVDSLQSGADSAQVPSAPETERSTAGAAAEEHAPDTAADAAVAVASPASPTADENGDAEAGSADGGVDGGADAIASGSGTAGAGDPGNSAVEDGAVDDDTAETGAVGADDAESDAVETGTAGGDASVRGGDATAAGATEAASSDAEAARSAAPAEGSTHAGASASASPSAAAQAEALSGGSGAAAPAGRGETPREGVGSDAPSAPAAPSASGAPSASAAARDSRSASAPRSAAAGDFDPGDYSDPYDDPYGDGDPYAGGDPYLSQGGGAPVPSSASEPGAPQPSSSRLSASRPPAPSPAAATPSAPAVATPAPTTAAPGGSAPGARPPGAPPADAQSAGDAAKNDGAEPVAKRPAPAFIRYGEAVVREVLGARFVEEHPLPPRSEA